jgi:ubiquitin C-terminal hydrolase
MLLIKDPRLIRYIEDDSCRVFRADLLDPDWAFELRFIPTGGYHRCQHLHPFESLRKFVTDRITSQGVASVPEDIRDAVCRSFAEAMTREGLDDEARTHLGEVLSDLTGGSVVITYLTQPRQGLEDCGVKGRLFRLTCVFPWAIDILHKHPNCLMTDATFKVLAPYTLPILHAIFANESIAIAFCITPTETADGYEAIYDHIRLLIEGLAQSGPDRTTASSPDPEQQNGDGPWPEAPSDDKETRVAGEFAPPPWVGDVPTVDAPVTGVRYPGSVGAELLRSIPLLSDQGPGLVCFIGRWGLTWKICHRHIIEAIGAKGLLGHWAARLLRCYSEVEWRHTVAVVLDEMLALRGLYVPSGAAYESLLRLLGITYEGDTHHLARKEHWALWLRLGCPRTTNSAESVNGHLNQSIDLKAPLSERIKQVAKHFMARYASRNTWCDRALKRNAHYCFPSDEARNCPWFSSEREEFYRELHNATRLTAPVKRRFPPEDPIYRFRRGFHEYGITRCDPPIPQEWPSSGGARAKEKEEDPESLPLHLAACQTIKTYLAWQIAQSVRKFLGRNVWKHSSSQVFANVVTIGTTMGVPDNGPASVNQEAEWRSQCWRLALQLPRAAPPTASPPNQRADSSARIGCSPFPKEFPYPADKVELLRGLDCEQHQQTPPQTARPRGGGKARAPAAFTAKLSAARKPPPPVGLHNRRFDCFFNATVQCLVHIPALRSYFTDEQFRNAILGNCTRAQAVAPAYCNLMSDLARCQTGTLSPLALRIALDPQDTHYPSCEEHDAMQLLQEVLDHLNEDLKGLRLARDSPESLVSGGSAPEDVAWNLHVSEYDTVITDLFFGQLCHSSTCPEGHVQRHFDVFDSLPLPLVDPRDPAYGIDPVKLETCLEWYFDSTESDSDNEAFCDRCRLSSLAVRKSAIQRLPRVLVLHLLRFQRTGRESHIKDDRVVTFPTRLDLSSYVVDPESSSSSTYTLISFLQHEGTMATGHYWSHVRKDLAWFRCDDISVQPVTLSTVLKSNPYILFYERLDDMPRIP